VMEQIKLLGTGLEPVSLGANTNAYIILAMVWYVPIAAGLSVVSLILGGAILNLRLFGNFRERVIYGGHAKSL